MTLIKYACGCVNCGAKCECLGECESARARETARARALRRARLITDTIHVGGCNERCDETGHYLAGPGTTEDARATEA